MKQRITQQDIANKLGIARSTVALALQGYHKISSQTKKRVKETARELGYVPDPFLSGLASYRKQRQPSSYQGQIICLVNVNDEGIAYPWRKFPHYYDYFCGAQKRTSQFGYRLVEVQYGTKGISPARLTNILQAQNINGILLCPQAHAEASFNFVWDKFSAVTFGYSLRRPALHTVAAAHLINTRNTIRELARRGYQRIGLVIDEDIDRRCGYNVSTGFFLEQTALARKSNKQIESIPPLLLYDSRRGPNRTDARRLANYIRDQQLDGLVTSDYNILENLKLVGIHVPGDIGVAGVSLPRAQGDLSGIAEDSKQVGAIAVDMLIGMMQRRECGVPAMPMHTHLEGTWHEGRSLRDC